MAFEENTREVISLTLVIENIRFIKRQIDNAIINQLLMWLEYEVEMA